MKAETVARVGATALRIYMNHLISFTAGAIGGGITVASALLAAKAAGVF